MAELPKEANELLAILVSGAKPLKVGRRDND